MSTLKCPACNHMFNYEYDYSEEFESENEYDFICENCGKKFYATASWELHFYDERELDELELDDDDEDEYDDENYS